MSNLAVLQPKSNGLALQPQNINEAMQMAEMLSTSNMVPSCYRGKTSDTLVAMMMGTELGLNPIQSLQNIAVINNRPCIWGDAMLALVQNHPKFQAIEESFDDSTMTAKCTVTRKGGKPHTSTFSEQDAVTAGLWGFNTWKKYPKRMLAMRARGFALRNQFADALLGLITAEEAQDIPIDDRHTIEPEQTKQEDQPISYYPQEDFDKNINKWNQVIKTGKLTKIDLIAKVETKGFLTEEQKEKIIGENDANS